MIILVICLKRRLLEVSRDFKDLRRAAHAHWASTVVSGASVNGSEPFPLMSTTSSVCFAIQLVGVTRWRISSTAIQSLSDMEDTHTNCVNMLRPLGQRWGSSCLGKLVHDRKLSAARSGDEQLSTTLKLGPCFLGQLTAISNFVFPWSQRPQCWFSDVPTLIPFTFVTQSGRGSASVSVLLTTAQLCPESNDP